MKLNNLYIVILFTIAFGCNNGEKNSRFNNKFLNVEKNKWVGYLKTLGYNQKVDDTVLLIMHTKECPPCLNELVWWNKNFKTYSDINFKLLLIEKYPAAVDAFKERFNIHLDILVEDDGEKLFDKSLVPATPIKIYINNTGTIKSIEPIGTNGNLGRFIELLSRN